MDSFFRIVVLEDSRADLLLIEESMQQAGLDCTITAFADGAAAVRYVNLTTSEIPDLLILDLNVPGADGCSVLNSVRGNTRWSDVAVLVFTASRSPADMARVRNLGANRYAVKPADLAGFLGFGRDVRQWLNAARGVSTSVSDSTES